MNNAQIAVLPKASKTQPFWDGCKTVDLRIDLVDGTAVVIQMSTNYAKAFAKALLHHCEK